MHQKFMNGDMICHFWQTFAENINKKAIIRCNFNKKFVLLWYPNIKKNLTEQKTNEQKTEKSNMKIRTVLKMEKVPAGNKCFICNITLRNRYKY